MPIEPIDAPDTYGAFEVVHRTLSRRASAGAFSLPRLSKADPGRLTIAMPHRVESLALGDLRRGTLPKRKKKQELTEEEKKEQTDCWRFLVLEDREPIAAATAIRAAGKLGFEFGGLDEGPFVRGTEEAILRAEDLAQVQDGQFEAVLLLVPARYVVALWLQDRSSQAADDRSGETDLLFAIPPSNPALDPAEPMPPARFLEALRQAR